jgi:type IV secretory pathway TraG/TraD family ATPase VirD4
LLTGNPEGVQSFVLNALTALRALTNPKVGWLTSGSDFALQDLRRRKTVVYFITPPQHAEYYSFLTSVFFRSVFNAAMRQMPAKSDLPIYVLYDEFGHSTIPSFVSTANTIRAYKVSLSIVLQSIAQLSARYGRDTAQAILGGFNTAMTYSGSDPETLLFFEKLCGKVRERQRRDLLTTNPQDQYREFNLVNADEIRTLAKDETIIVSTNRNPARIKTVGYFESRQFRKMSALGPAKLKPRRVMLNDMPLVKI